MKRPTSTGPVENERGGALLLVLVLLLALGPLAALWLAVSGSDLYIAAARRAEHRRRYAAEGALAEVLAALKTGEAGAVSRRALLAADPSFSSPVAEGVFAGMAYGWQAGFLADRGDADGDAGTETVLYSRAFGYRGAPFPSGGFPVVRVFLDLADGAGSSTMRADLTPVALNPTVEAAWTGGGDLLFEGNVRLSGFDHDGKGRPAAGGALPAVRAGGAVSFGAGSFAAGPPGRENRTGVEGVLPERVEDLLAGGDTFASLEEFPRPPDDGSCLDGIFFLPGHFEGPLCGRGVLIVHNPSFDPVRYEASRLLLEEGIRDAELDPSYSHLDAGNQPARLDLYRGGTFRGLVVADALPIVSDGARIVGGVVTLSRSPAVVRGEAPLEVLFSRKTIAEVSLGPLSHRIGVWSPAEAAGLLNDE